MEIFLSSPFNLYRSSCVSHTCEQRFKPEQQSFLSHAHDCTKQQKTQANTHMYGDNGSQKAYLPSLECILFRNDCRAITDPQLLLLLPGLIGP